MSFQLVKKYFLVLFLSSLITTYASTALSGKDGMSGGGNAVGDELLDFYENKGTRVFNPKETKAYKEVLKQIFDYLDEKSPSVAAFLAEGFESKTWLLEPKVISEDSCRNQSVIKAKKTTVACQNKNEIRISKAWMQSTDLTQQAGLIMHELLVHHALHDYALNNSQKDISRKEMESDVRNFNRKIFAREFLGADDLIRAVSVIFRYATENRKFYSKIEYLKIKKISEKISELQSLADTYILACEKYSNLKEPNGEIILGALEEVYNAKTQWNRIDREIFENELRLDDYTRRNSYYLDRSVWTVCDTVGPELVKLYQSRPMMK